MKAILRYTEGLRRPQETCSSAEGVKVSSSIVQAPSSLCERQSRFTRISQQEKYRLIRECCIQWAKTKQTHQLIRGPTMLRYVCDSSCSVPLKMNSLPALGMVSYKGRVCWQALKWSQHIFLVAEFGLRSSEYIKNLGHAQPAVRSFRGSAAPIPICAFWHPLYIALKRFRGKIRNRNISRIKGMCSGASPFHLDCANEPTSLMDRNRHNSTKNLGGIIWRVISRQYTLAWTTTTSIGWAFLSHWVDRNTLNGNIDGFFLQISGLM